MKNIFSLVKKFNSFFCNLSDNSVLLWLSIMELIEQISDCPRSAYLMVYAVNLMSKDQTPFQNWCDAQPFFQTCQK